MSMGGPQFQLTAAYKVILLAVICMTFVSFLGMVVTMLFAGSAPGPIVQGGFDTFSKGFMLGFGAFVGLLGGKFT
jgi:hypothetical protein